MANHNNRHTSGLRVLQHNAGRGKVATAELREWAVKEKAPILLIQEPYARGSTVAGLGTLSNRLLTGTREGEVPWTCVAVMSRDLDVTLLRHLSTPHCVCAEISTRLGDIYMVSAYFPPSRPIDGFIGELKKVLDTLRGSKILIGVDVNGRSPLWGSRIADHRGSKFEDFVAETGLFVVNEPNNPFTFSSANGHSNIDVTLVTPALLDWVRDWRVRVGWTNSDHRVIDINLDSGVYKDQIRTPRFNIKRADWDGYKKEVRERIRQVDWNSDVRSADDLAEDLEIILREAAVRYIPRKKYFQKSVPWWNQALTNRKRQVNKARRKYQRSQNSVRRAQMKAEYDGLRRAYCREVNQAKVASWREFITVKGREAYGLAYKVLREKITPDTVLTGISSRSGTTDNWRDTAGALLECLVPDGDEEDLDMVRVLCEGNEDLLAETTPPWSAVEISKVLKSLPRNKAPGKDLIETEMIRCFWNDREVLAALMGLFSRCLEEGTFPKLWKQGSIRMLLKSRDKDPTDPRSHRPICLLPYKGKVLEQLMKSRLESIIMHPVYSSDRQYGYRRGRSTEDALCELRRIISGSSAKYVLALLYDATAAFDNLWWPGLLRELRQRGCSHNLLRLVGSYLMDRTVELSGNYNKYEKHVTKGCPQGSILGPNFWNVVFDGLLRRLGALGSGIWVIAYADDLLVLVEANSRLTLENRSQEVTDVVCGWFDENRLTLSASKTEMILLKGSLPSRDPIVRIGDRALRAAECVRYLGVTLGARLSITGHVERMVAKGKIIMDQLAKVAKAHWGLEFQAMLTLYKGVFLAIVCYGAGAWADLVQASHRRILMKAQRYALLRISKSYRTVSSDALQVLTGCMPLDLVIAERYALYKIRKGMECSMYGFTYVFGEDGRKARKDLRVKIMEEWQRRWEASDKGRTTFGFMPDVRLRETQTWIKPGYYLCQALSGHGNFKAKLAGFALSDSYLCECGEEETSEHVLFECVRHEERRRDFRNDLHMVNANWPPDRAKLLDKENYHSFEKYVHRVLAEVL